MAKLESIFTVKGKVAGGTAYKTKYGNIFRTNGTLDKNRITTDPSFSMLRNNMGEFGGSASSGKAVRNSLKSCASDMNGSATFLLTKYMRELCNSSTLPRGQRVPLVANYNTKKVKLFKRDFSEVSRKTVDVVINGDVTVTFSPVASDLIVPPIRQSVGSVLVYRVGCTAGIFDLATLKSEEMSGTTSAYIPVSAPVAYTGNIITSTNITNGADFLQVAVFIEFAEELNGVTYPIGGGRYYVVEGEAV